MKFCEKYTDINYIISDDCRKTITLKDKGASTSKYVCENNKKKKITIYKVDGGIIKSQIVNKCDFALYNNDNDVIYFIELKGSDYDQAIEQISSSISNLITSNNIKINIINARIVLTKVRAPEINTTKEKKLKLLLNKYKGTLIKKTNLMTEHI